MDKDHSDLSSGKTSPSSRDECDNLISPSIKPIIDTGSKNSYPPFYKRSILKRGSYRKTRRRVVLKNGDCNVVKMQLSNRSYRYLQDLFTTLIDIQWRFTLLCFAMAFVLSWLVFGFFWWLVLYNHGDFEPNHLPDHQEESGWTPCVMNINSFLSVFLFSLETQHTIGFGSRYPTEDCAEGVFLICVQSVLGVIIHVLMAGIVLSKMSRPKQRTQTLLFSKNMVVNTFDGQLCLMFRVADIQKSLIIGATIRCLLLRFRFNQEGHSIHSSEELEVGTDGHNDKLLFLWPETIIHKIDSHSPFYPMSPKQILSENFEIIVILEGTIESTGQATQARSSYLAQEIVWGHEFENMVTYSETTERFEVDYSLFNKTREVRIPQCSAKYLEEYKSFNQNNQNPSESKLNNPCRIMLDGHDNHGKADNLCCDYIQPSDAQYLSYIIDIPDIDEISDELIHR